MRSHLLRAAAGAEVDTAWNTNFPAASLFTDTPQNWFDASAQETFVTDLFFKSDGTEMYIVGSSGDKVNQYSLSTAWDIRTAAYAQNFSVSTEEGQPAGLFFGNNGTKMYITGATGDDVNEYTLSSAWDISSATYTQNFSVASQEAAPQGLFFKDDGLEMYVAGSNSDSVHQYTLTTAWDVSTATFTRSLSVSAKETSPSSVTFKADGTKMYVTGVISDLIHEYNLSTAWDLSTATWSTSANLGNQDAGPSGIFFKPDGSALFMVGYARDSVWHYSLSTTWDVTTLSFTWPTNDRLDIGNEEASPAGVFFKPDGTKLFVAGFSGDEVNEYTLSTPWVIGSASFVQNFSVSAQDGNPFGLFFKDDGTKMYISGATNDSIYEYALSSAWDISTASYSTSFSVATQEAQPGNLFFKSDGTKMYVTGEAADAVHEYNLSTAWDISTSSYSQSFVDASRLSFANGLSFKSDGTKMYVANRGNNNLYEFNLSTAWDVSTATPAHGGWSYGFFVSSFRGLFFKDDGTKFWAVDNAYDIIYGFTLSI